MEKEIERVEVYFLAEGGIHLIDETVNGKLDQLWENIRKVTELL